MIVRKRLTLWTQRLPIRLWIETNGDYVRRILATPEFHAGEVHTRFLNDLA